jgi:DNA helicase-2/ATP-dependent DNA helicase PcrA
VDLLERGLFAGRAQTAMSVFRSTIEELRPMVENDPLPVLLEAVLDRTGYKRMLEADKSPESETRLENLSELLNAAAEAAERGEGLAEFLDHAALVAQTDGIDEAAKVSLLTVHNAKGLEFPIVFLAGMEENLFPHSRSRDSESMLEEERRLCYVGMTRAEKRLTMSYARARRRFGGGPLEPAMRSRFLLELPPEIIDEKGGEQPAWGQGARSGSTGGAGWGRPSYGAGEIDLMTEQHEVRQAAAKNLYNGKTYNSVDNISEFFQNRGMSYREPQRGGGGAGSSVPPAAPPGVRPPQSPNAQQQYPPMAPKTVPGGVPKFGAVAGGRPKAAASGAYVQHPKYGRGQVLRREGDGDQAKLTVMFPGHGIKKLFEKFAGLQVD